LNPTLKKQPDTAQKIGHDFFEAEAKSKGQTTRDPEQSGGVEACLQGND